MAARGRRQVRLVPRPRRRLSCLPPGCQFRQHRGDPPRPAPRIRQLRRDLIPAPAGPGQLIFRSVFSVRFADRDAFAAIFVPSSAIVPSFPIPSRAHSTSTSPNSDSTAPGNAGRNRQIVT